MKKTVKIKDGKINFFCPRGGCMNNCCGPFSGISSELVSIDERPFDEIVLTWEDYEKLYRNGYAYLVEEGYSEETQKKYYKMALHPDGTCKAFVDGKCTIHEFSPTLCKAFPFYYDMFSGLCAIACDGFSDDNWTDISQYEECFTHAKKMYQFWLDFYTKTEE